MASGQGRCMTTRIRVQGSGAAADRSAKYLFSIAVRSRGKPRNILFRSHGRAGPYKPFPPMLEDCCCPAVCSKYFHRLSCGGTGAVMRTGLRRTGWTNSIERACSEMLPSRFERGAPYFRSPRIGHPIFDNWARIWWCLPVSSSISSPGANIHDRCLRNTADFG